MRTVFHWGGFSRNYGDLAILYAQQTRLAELCHTPIRFITLNSDIGFDHSVPVITRRMVDHINQEGDMLLIGGGGQIMYREPYESRSGWQFNINIDDLRCIEVPIVVYAVGVNYFPFERIDPRVARNTITHLKEVHKRAELFSVRDPGSAQRLLGMGFDRKVEVVPDPAMFCPSLKRTIEIRGLERNQNAIGLNLACDRTNLRYEINGVRAVVRNLCTGLLDLAQQYDAKVVYIPHVTHYDFDLLPFLTECLGDRLINIADVFPEMYPESIGYVPLLVSVYERMDMVVGQRGHSNIIPFGKNVPFVAFGDHPKNLYFADYVGGMRVGNNCSGLRDVLYFALNSKTYKDDLKKSLTRLTKTANSFDKKVVELLEK